MKYYLFMIPFFLFVSCQDIKKEKQVQEINQMLQKMDNIHNSFIENKNDSIKKIIASVMEVELRIRQNYNSDTIPLELGKKVNEYKMIAKKLSAIHKLYTQLEKGTLEEKESLKKLKKDIENSLGQRAKYDEYLKLEKKKVKQLENIFDEMISEQQKSIKSYYQLHKELNEFSFNLIEK